MTTSQTSSWNVGMADAYEDLLVPVLFEPFADDLMQRLTQRKPRNILEIAAGTGAVTRRMVDGMPEASIVATDLNESMVEVGRQRAPGAKWQQADASELPFGDSSFDAVVCQFGAMFFPDKPVAFSQTHRVLKPGGRLLLNVWAPLEQNDLAHALDDSIRSVFPDDPPTFIRTMPHGYADTEQVRADLRSGGFTDIAYETVTFESKIRSISDFAIGFCTGSPLRMQLEQRGDISELTSLITKEFSNRLGDDTAFGKLTAFVFDAGA